MVRCAWRSSSVWADVGILVGVRWRPSWLLRVQADGKRGDALLPRWHGGRRSGRIAPGHPSLLSVFAAKLTNVLGGIEAIGYRLDRLGTIFSNGASGGEADGTSTALHAVAIKILVVLVVAVTVVAIYGRIASLPNGMKSCVFHGSASRHRPRR